MRILRVLSVVLSVTVLFAAIAPTDSKCFADGEHISAAASAEEEVPQISFGKCRAAAVYECSTGTLLAGINDDKVLPIGHLAKLMTFLIAAEKIGAGELSLNDTAVCSSNANAQQDPQIWLGIGEKIDVGELMRSISVGNANDACVCLAEKMSEKEEYFTEIENRKAKELEMSDTVFCDCTGDSENTVSTASDLCRLGSELVKLENFSQFFTTWMDTVRGGRAELVSRNRLMRSYKGIRGFKVGSTASAGACALICATKADMTVCAVILGCEDEEPLLEQAEKLLDSAFAYYEVYHPEVPEEAVEDIRIEHGVSPDAVCEIPLLRPIIIRKGTYRSISCTFSREDKLIAPVEKGTKTGEIVFRIDDDILISEDICTAEAVDEVDLGFNLKRILYNLLNF